MKVQTHIKTGELLAVVAAQTRGNGHATAGVLGGDGALSLEELLELLRREALPWFQPPADPTRGLNGSARNKSASRSFAVADQAIQDFTLRYIDPLMGAGANRHLQDMGLPAAPADITSIERYINRHLVIGLGSTAATIAGTTVMPPLLVVGALGTLYATLLPAGNAYRSLKKGKLTAALTATLASWGAWLGGYYLAGALGSVVFAAGDKLLFKSQNRARQNLVTAYSQQPRTATKMVEGLEVEVPFEQVKVNDTVVAHAGQPVPVDGTIVEGIATIDQHMLTGEAQPVERGVDDSVLATTMVLTGKILIRVEKAGQATTASEITRILSHLDSHHLSIDAKAVSFGDRAVLPTLLMSGAALPLLGVNSAVALLRFPLAAPLRMTAPIAMLNYLSVLSRYGILVKDSRSLELLANVDTVVFDKTGTLTLEQPHVAEVHGLNGAGSDQVLGLAAMAEQYQSHPIARAIIAAAQERGLPLRPIDDAQLKVGFGIEVRENGQLIQVGSARFMAMQGVAITDTGDAQQQRCAAEGHSLVFTAVDGHIAGAIELHSTVRPEAKQLIQRLHERGLQVHILSGDQEAPTRRLAEELGVEHFSANVLPEDKAAMIEQLQTAGQSVCFVGDGINDAIALKKAHVSVSLRGATTVAIDAAQIVLLQQNLDPFVRLLEIARELDATQRRSFDIVRGLRVALIGGVLLFSFDIYWSLVVMAAGSIAGLVNATTPMRKYKTDSTVRTDSSGTM